MHKNQFLVITYDLTVHYALYYNTSIDYRFPKAKSPCLTTRAFFIERSTVTYFHTGNLHYHRRGFVSLSCSRWEGVGPKRYCHRALKLKKSISFQYCPV